MNMENLKFRLRLIVRLRRVHKADFPLFQPIKLPKITFFHPFHPIKIKTKRHFTVEL